ncbi:MAG TPA: VOC family protein [Candidatus Acidoferrum sp.]|nr:VOC family protein [Candidatus Acidoferrum sp.]
MISRRLFLTITGGAILSPRLSRAANEVPSLLDHILLGCHDLDRGIAFVEERTGVRAAFGGVHPGRGTRNALVSLGERRYLEIIAPDPAQPDVADTYGLRRLTEPRLVHWAAHPGDLDAFAKKLREAGVPFKGPTPGSRKRSDGRVLSWKTLNLAEDRDGLLPFFIEWSAGSLHPSADSPKGCSLLRFEALAPDPENLSKTTATLGLDLSIAKADQPQLRAIIPGPHGQFSVAS